MTLAEKIGAVLTATRKKAGGTRRGKADELGIAASTLFKIEHGRENLTLARVERVAAGYGIELEVVARPAAGERAAGDG